MKIAAAAAVAAFLLSGCGGESRKGEPRFAPSTPAPTEVGARLSEKKTLTLDGRDSARWAYADFSRGSVVVDPEIVSADWDLASKRYFLRTNGGRSNPSGQGGVVDLGAVPFEAVSEAPLGGYLEDVVLKRGEESRNPALARWYDYSIWTNILRSMRHVYILRTGDGRYAKFRIVSYYCDDAASGCMTIEYVYQGDGSRKLR